MARRPHKEVVEELLRTHGADDRDVYVVLARAGLLPGESTKHKDIGEACGERFGYSISKQRVHSLIRRYAELVGPEGWAEVSKIAPNLALPAPIGAVGLVRREENRRKRAIGRMRRQARGLAVPLQYQAVLDAYEVEVPAHRDRTASIMDAEESMRALYADFKVVAACGWRICYDCKTPKLISENYYTYANGKQIPWCKACNRTRAKRFLDKRKRFGE